MQDQGFANNKDADERQMQANLANIDKQIKLEEEKRRKSLEQEAKIKQAQQSQTQVKMTRLGNFDSKI